jgi:hypothetical protein
MSEARPHSKLGLASVAVATTTGSLTFLLIVLSALPLIGPDTEARLGRIATLFLWTGPIFYLAGLVMGTVALLQKETKRVFAVVGIIVNGLPLTLFLTVVLWVVWIVVASGGGSWH